MLLIYNKWDFYRRHFFYIANYLLYKCINDLNIHKKWPGIYLKLSTQKNHILLFESFTDIYLMDLIVFNSIYLRKLLENVSREKKSVLIWIFWIIMIISFSFIPLILEPTEITGHSITLLDLITCLKWK